MGLLLYGFAHTPFSSPGTRVRTLAIWSFTHTALLGAGTCIHTLAISTCTHTSFFRPMYVYTHFGSLDVCGGHGFRSRSQGSTKGPPRILQGSPKDRPRLPKGLPQGLPIQGVPPRVHPRIPPKGSRKRLPPKSLIIHVVKRHVHAHIHSPKRPRI